MSAAALRCFHEAGQGAAAERPRTAGDRHHAALSIPAPPGKPSLRRPRLYLASHRCADGAVRTFDTFGRMLKLTYPDGEVLTNAYDSGGNLKSAEGVKGISTTAEGTYHYYYLHALHYDKFEQRVLMHQGNGVKTAYTYDAKTRRLDNLSAGKSGGTLFQDLNYDYDQVGNVLSLKNLADLPSANVYGGPGYQRYQYDDLYRMTQAQGVFPYDKAGAEPDATSCNGSQNTHCRAYKLEMAYDTIHNIKHKTQLDTRYPPGASAIPQKKTTYNWDYTYNPSGTSSTRPHAPIHIGERAFTYDANGNQTGWTHDQNGTRRTILWDEENRIQTVADNGHEKTYKYDDQGQRIIKRGPQGETVYVNQFYTQRPGATGTKHIYAGTTRITSKLVKQDTPNSNPQGSTPFEKDLYFYHPDHLGSSSYVTDLNGKLYEHLEYFPFGEGWIEENSNAQRTPYLFTAKELDEETGLYYFGARYYDPRTSVWQSADPILEKYLPSGDKEQNQNLPGRGGVFHPLNLGLYTYSHQNPVRLVDPDGNAVFENAEKLKEAGKAVLADTSVQPGANGGATWCNRGVGLIETRGGNTESYRRIVNGQVQTDQYMYANDLVAKLKDEKAATKVTPEQAVEYAKQGVTVVAGWQNSGKDDKGNPRPGHVAIVAPEDMQPGGGGKVPMLFNVGPKDSMGLIKASEAFDYSNPDTRPSYYVRNEDLKTLHQREAANAANK